MFLLTLVFVLFSNCYCNVLFILGDDMGFESLVYDNIPQTPNLLQLAKVGITFENAYTSVSSCSPSRASILTGLPQHQNGMYGLHHSYHHFNSFENLKSLPYLLKMDNVYTGIIGKKHVGPSSVFSFDFEVTEETHSIMQVGRNITFISSVVKRFFLEYEKRVTFFNDDGFDITLIFLNTDPFYIPPLGSEGTAHAFLLLVAFHDPHRCSHSHPEYGSFCQKFGDGSHITADRRGNLIPDWQPKRYEPSRVRVPYFVPDTPVSRDDIAAQYTVIDRMDQGIGLVLRDLQSAGHTNSTMVLFTSDNGIPFPSGRTNAYQPALRVPLVMTLPALPALGYHVSSSAGNGSRDREPVIISEDVLPTILDWFNISVPGTYPIFKGGLNVTLRGVSFLRRQVVKTNSYPVLPNSVDKDVASNEDEFLPKVPYAVTRPFIYASHSSHEITGYYPMRTIIDHDNGFKLIHNLNFGSRFPIDQDFYLSPTFQDMLNRTASKTPLNWNKSLKEYYYRPEWEFFDLDQDPEELDNLYPSASKEPSLATIFQRLRESLMTWQNVTNDPWLCVPDGIMVSSPQNPHVHTCGPL